MKSELDVYKSRCEKLSFESGFLHCAEKQLQVELGKAKEENKRLREFARHVIRQECWSLFDQDGHDLQELAEKLGLIVPGVATQEDVDDELYNSYYELDDTMYKFSETLKGS